VNFPTIQQESHDYTTFLRMSRCFLGRPGFSPKRENGRAFAAYPAAKGSILRQGSLYGSSSPISAGCRRGRRASTEPEVKTDPLTAAEIMVPAAANQDYCEAVRNESSLSMSRPLLVYLHDVG